MKVTDLWRHPIKSHGREKLERVALTRGQTMPFDRIWAVAHEAAKILPDTKRWAPCANFSRGSKAPSLMAINARMDEANTTITLTHPSRPDLTINPDLPQDAAKLIEWVTPLCPADRAQPQSLYSAAGRGLTDSDFPSVSLNSHASLRALSEKAGQPVSSLRFRGNIWIDDAEPWAELDWVGREIQIGGARLKVIERTERCKATTANPESGKIDLNTLDVLQNNWGHLDFGVRAEVIESGEIKIGDPVHT